MTDVTLGTKSDHLFHFTGEAPWNSAFLRNMPADRAALPDYKTIIVVGAAHSGTSVVAAVLDAIGIFMGPPSKLRAGGAFENPEMLTGDPAETLAAIERNNRQHRIWGWKHPRGACVMQHLPDSIRNPYCIFVLRDPVAMAYRYQFNPEVPKGGAVEHCLQEVRAIIEVAAKTAHPSMLVSFERVKTTPEFFVRNLIEFLNVFVTPDRWVEALGRISDRGGYLTMPHEYGVGPGNESRKSEKST